MTKLQKSKKGFTLTELAIVIAVIAILIAVLVPTFTSLINKAQESSDSQLVKNLNTALSTDEAIDGKAETMAEALAVASENGYNVDKLTPASTGDIVWDQESNRFLLIDEDGEIYYKDDTTTITDSELSTNAYQLWYIAKSESDVEKGTYSYYLDYETTAVTAKYGVDVGENESVAVTISSDDTASVTGGNEAKSNGVALASKKLTAGSTSTAAIRINTNGGTLTISSTAVENIEHYGTATNVEVAASSTYKTYAAVSTSITISASNVTVAAEENSSTIAIVVKSNLSGVTVTVAATATVTTVFDTDGNATVSGATTSKEDFSTYYAIVGSSYYTKLTEAVSAASNGDTVTLLQDYTSSSIDSLYTIGTNLAKDVTIDLNGYTITYSGSTISLSDGNTALTFKNGNIKTTRPTYTNSVFEVTEGATISMENMNVDAKGSIILTKGNASTINVINSTLYTTGVYCVGTNAATASNYNIKINLENSTFTTECTGDKGKKDGDSCAVIINVPGILNITNCTITGDRQGVVVRAGTATITNTTINCTGGYTGSAFYNTAETKTWGSGNEVPMGALIIGSRSGSYSGDATVTCYSVTLNYQGDTTNGYSVYMYGGVTYPESNTTANYAILKYDSACSLGTITQGETTYTEVKTI